MDVIAKLNKGKDFKDAGDQAFKAGKHKEALMSYHQALMYLNGLDKNALSSMGFGVPPPPSDDKDKDNKGKDEKTEADEILEKVYANMAACYIKNGNWARAVESSTKALAKNPENYKAMFRKGKALGEQGFFEKGKKILEEQKTKNPSDSEMVDAEIARLKAMDDAKEKAYRKKQKGFLNKAEKAKGDGYSLTEGAEEPQITESKIEEVS